MSKTFTLRRHPRQPGPATLRATVDEGGLTALIPGALGVNLLAGIAAPRAVNTDGTGIKFLHRRPGEPFGEAGWRWDVESGAVQGSWKMTFAPDGLVLAFAVNTSQRLGLLTPLAVPVRADAGSLILPGKTGWNLHPEVVGLVDLADQREASQSVPIKDGSAAWALSSQGGLAVIATECNHPFHEIQVDRLGESRWRVGLVHRDLPPESHIEGKLVLRVLPFNGCTDLKRIVSVSLAAPASVEFPKAPKPELEASELEEDGSLTLELDGHRLRVTATEERRPLRSKTVDDILLSASRTTLGDQDVWKITLRLRPVRALRALRLEAKLETLCENPTWDGDATVVIPGNFARTNYHPDHVHGGGPKYGPDPIPKEREPHVTNDEAPGRCHGWTFAGSRLPQVWAAAADRSAKRFAWIGTTPRSALGENCAGFLSPKGRTTALRLATPTTCEPWVPLGYSRMRPGARRDAAEVPEDEIVTWTFWVAISEADDLNAWAPLDRALYLHTRPSEPTPIKLTLEEAARICAGAIHGHFYDAERGAVVYSTGPQGQHAPLAFTGMAHAGLTMLWAGEEFGEEKWRAAGTRVMDTVARMFLEGPGFPWTAMNPGGASGAVESFGVGSGEPGYVTMVAFDNLAEALRRERAWKRDHANWEMALRRCADHWVKNQAPDGAFPHWGPDFGEQFEENESGITNIEAGVIANMVDAHALFGDERYLEAAKSAAALYGSHLDDGRLWGGPGDVRALVNSEVPMFMLRGFRRLFEVTQSDEHRRRLLTAAAWRHLFQYAHSWPCDADSPLWRQGWAGLGGESASACNLHMVAFGCINVPDAWALWKITGDECDRMRCEDLARYSVQQFARFAGDLGFPFAGAGTESWWASESVWGKGHPWIFSHPGFDLGFMSWVTAWSGYGALCARECGIEI